ncbi:MAG: AAA family ATPase [Magnetococcales bacterium]|nr:AAA family ATPase [Magnetococcales bacterium]
MYIDRLLLTRYGRFTSTEIDIAQGRGADLVVLLGQNEAGKSTLRTAISDLLFGIPERTPHNFIHRYDALQLGASLINSRGERIDLQRVKRRGPSLQDQQGQPLPDAVLHPFLGDADRPLFDHLFGLSQETLRAGGEQMLKAEGRLGEMIFGAAGGMHDLVTLLASLNEEARYIYTARRRSALPFYQALDAWQEARRKVNQLLVGVGEWQEAQHALTAAEEEQNQILATSRQLLAERNRLERLRRTLPPWQELKTIETELTSLATVPLLPKDAPVRFRQALEQTQRGHERHQEQENDLRTIEKEAQALLPNLALLARADEILAIHEGRGAVIKARKDLPGLLGQWQRCNNRLEQLARDLGHAWGADAVVRHLPSGLLLEEVQRLIGEATRLDTEEKRARERVSEAETERMRIQESLACQSPPPDCTPLRLALEHARSQGDLPGQLARLRRSITTLERQIQESLDQLPLWRDDVSQLARVAVPVAATVQHFARKFELHARLLERMHERLDTLTQEHRLKTEALAGLATETTLPTPEAIADARAARDRLWHQLYGWLVAGQPPREGATPALVAEHYLRQLLIADQLADRRVVEADRLARHAALMQELRRIEQERDDATRELQAAQQMHAVDLEQWRRNWTFLAAEPGQPAEMTAWMTRREAILRLWEEAAAARVEAESLQEALAKAELLLAQTLAPLAPPQIDASNLALRMRQAQEVIERLERAQSSWSALLDEQGRCQAILQRETRRLAEVTKRQDALREKWLPAVQTIGLTGEVTIEVAGPALTVWREIRQEATQRRDLEERMAGMRQEEEHLTRWVRTAAVELALAPIDADTADTGKDPLLLAQELFDTLTLHRERAQRKRELQRRMTQTTALLRQTDAAITQARTILDSLRDQAGVATEDALATILTQSERKRALQQRADALRQHLIAEADGLSLDQATAEAAAADPEQVRVEIDQLTQHQETLFAASGRAGERVQALRSGMAELVTGRGAAAANQDGRDALDRLQGLAHRWMVLRAAGFLLATGIDRYRQERQGPILERAGRLFSRLTCGRFIGFHAEYDREETPILFGLRANNTTCPVSGMSDGTQDQLYLALRVAIIEAYNRVHEPLPFIADDLFVNFDDARAAAGFDLLLQLAESTQVLFLTHHHHLATLARQRARTRVVALEE